MSQMTQTRRPGTGIPFRSSNPVLRDDVFETATPDTRTAVMTLNGTVLKTCILVAILLATASFSWSLTQTMQPADQPTYVVGLIAAALLAFVVALVTSFVPKFSPFTAPLYAALEGLVLGAISSLFEATYQGIVLQAVSLTMGVLVTMLLAYVARIVRPTQGFKMAIVSMTGAIFLVYLVSMGLSLFGMRVPYIHDSGPIGIAFSCFVVLIASLNLVLDFEFIEVGVAQGAAKYMEWYAGFGLLVTLVWLYLEILKLLAKLRKK